MLLLFLSITGWAAPVALLPQVITLPASGDQSRFVDIDGDGRLDLIVLDPVEKKLLNYHQRPGGFSNSPDQVIPLPPQTVWIGLCKVDAHPGLELLFSTATGVVYSRQNAGLFESDRRTLIEANQVFSNFDFPILTRLSTNDAATNFSIPVISAGHAVLYNRISAEEWRPGPPMPLDLKRTSWQVRRYDWNDPWTLGANDSYNLSVSQTFRARSEQKPDREPWNKAIQKIIDDLNKNTSALLRGTDEVDVDGDGRKDLVLWQVSGKFDFKTDIYIFLRGADQQLPERPTQTLHCRGLPLATGSQLVLSPMINLTGNGPCELVLREFHTAITSASGALETALSHGMDWSVTIRKFHDGAFSRSPDASAPVTAVLLTSLLASDEMFIDGDFNGDGRPDLLVRRSETQWNIFFSTDDKSWFAPQPAMTFNVPAHGSMEIKDLNNDGLADVILREPDEHRLSIFLSPSRPAKGRNP